MSSAPSLLKGVTIAVMTRPNLAIFYCLTDCLPSYLSSCLPNCLSECLSSRLPSRRFATWSGAGE